MNMIEWMERGNHILCVCVCVLEYSLGVLLLVVVTEEQTGQRPPLMGLPLMKTPRGGREGRARGEGRTRGGWKEERKEGIGW